jgi:hypothetical protein
MDLNYDDLNDLHSMEGTFSRTCWGHYPVSRMTIPRYGEEILSLFNGQMSNVDDPTEEPFWDAYAIYRITANGVNKSAALVAVWRLIASKLPPTSLHFTHSIVRRFEAEQSPRDGLTSNLTLRANLHTGTLHTRFPCAVDDE